MLLHSMSRMTTHYRHHGDLHNKGVCHSLPFLMIQPVKQTLLTLKKSRQPVQRGEFLLCKLKLRDTCTQLSIRTTIFLSSFISHRLGRLYFWCFHISFPTLLLLHIKVTKCWWEDPSCTLRRRCTPLWHSPAFHGDVAEPSTQSKARLSSNPDVSNRNIKKTELSLFRGLAVCYLSLQVCVISPRYTVTVPVLRESYLLGSQ